MSTLLLLITLSIFSTSTTTATQQRQQEEAFINCFNNLTINSHNVSQTQTVLFTFNPSSTSNYTTILLSNARNRRTLSHSHKPLLIITPTRPFQVQATIVCSRKHDLRIRTRSGGHDYEALSFLSTASSPFILLDLNNLRDITIDTHENTAWAGAGATIGELYYHISKASPLLGFPAGICPTVGLGGFISGGGIGVMTRRFGTAADNVVDALLVDVEGRVLDRSSMGEDLFWAIRGGGAVSFGVILAYKVELVAVPPTVAVFGVKRSLKQNLTSSLSKWEKVSSKMRKDMFLRVFLGIERDRGSEVGNTIKAQFQCMFLGGKRELLGYLGETLPEIRVRVRDVVELSWIGSMMYFAGYYDFGSTEQLLDRAPQKHMIFKGKSDFVVEGIGEKGWERVWEFLLGTKGEHVALIMDPLGGVMDEIDEGSTPYPYRKGYLYGIQYFMFKWRGRGLVGDVDEEHLEWMRELYDFMEPYVSKNPRGAYVNYKDIDLGRNGDVVGSGSYESGEVWGRRYFKGNYERLAKVKGVVDKGNFFWSEQSIPPLLL